MRFEDRDESARLDWIAAIAERDGEVVALARLQDGNDRALRSLALSLGAGTIIAVMALAIASALAPHDAAYHHHHPVFQGDRAAWLPMIVVWPMSLVAAASLLSALRARWHGQLNGAHGATHYDGGGGEGSDAYALILGGSAPPRQPWRHGWVLVWGCAFAAWALLPWEHGWAVFWAGFWAWATFCSEVAEAGFEFDHGGNTRKAKARGKAGEELAHSAMSCEHSGLRRRRRRVAEGGPVSGCAARSHTSPAACLFAGLLQVATCASLVAGLRWGTFGAVGLLVTVTPAARASLRAATADLARRCCV